MSTAGCAAVLSREGNYTPPHTGRRLSTWIDPPPSPTHPALTVSTRCAKLTVMSTTINVQQYLFIGYIQLENVRLNVYICRSKRIYWYTFNLRQGLYEYTKYMCECANTRRARACRIPAGISTYIRYHSTVRGSSQRSDEGAGLSNRVEYIVSACFFCTLVLSPSWSRGVLCVPTECFMYVRTYWIRCTLHDSRYSRTRGGKRAETPGTRYNKSCGN